MIDIKEANKISKTMISNALELGLKVEKITNSNFKVSNGEKVIRFVGSMPETTSAIDYRLAMDKFFTNKILKKIGIPVLAMEKFKDIESAQRFLKENQKIVVKPRKGTHGKGITVGVTNNKQLQKAIALAQDNGVGEEVTLEKYFSGDDFRILVIGKKKIFVINRVPAQVVGDGKKKISELIDDFNHNLKNYSYPIEKDKITLTVLSFQNKTLQSIPQKGEKIFLRFTANVKSGGMSIEMTDKINPKTKENAIKIAKAFNMDIVGIDWLSPDISQEKGFFIEINAYPGILLHHYPTHGKSYNVAQELLNYFFFPANFN